MKHAKEMRDGSTGVPSAHSLHRAPRFFVVGEGPKKRRAGKKKEAKTASAGKYSPFQRCTCALPSCSSTYIGMHCGVPQLNRLESNLSIILRRWGLQQGDSRRDEEEESLACFFGW